MPTRIDTNFPRLKSDDEFENLILELCRREWNDPNTSDRHGRSGQDQQGVDIYGKPADQNGKTYGAQCKLRTGGRQPTEAEIEYEVERAKTFSPALGLLIIATDAPRDAKTQRIVRDIDESQRLVGSFAVAIWFWDSICIRLSAYTPLIVRYFHDLLTNLTTAHEAERLIDIPIHVLSLVFQNGAKQTLLEEALELRGIRIVRSPDPQANSAISPDGILCQYVEIDDTQLPRFAALVLVQTSRDAPLFVTLPLRLHDGFQDALRSLGGNPGIANLIDSSISENAIARVIFERIFTYGYRRRGSLGTVDLSIRSSPTRPRHTLLDINWESRLSSSHLPTLEEWNSWLSTALDDIRRQLGLLGDDCLIQLRPILQLPAALAWGYALNIRVARLGVWARETGTSDFRQQYWRSDAELQSLALSQNWVSPIRKDINSIIIELAIGFDIHNSVESFLSKSVVQSSAWLQIGHENTDPRLSKIDEASAVSYAAQIGEIIRRIKQDGITDFHLFMYMPASLAVLIGQRLQACGRIHLYWYDNPSYQYAFTLQ